ncbi:MAG TPA: hypothetical protein VGP68_06450 [Gemmataceae bacterium]|nr:hypothetical protein [Gemmataceae bacterium]
MDCQILPLTGGHLGICPPSDPAAFRRIRRLVAWRIPPLSSPIHEGECAGHLATLGDELNDNAAKLD